MLERLGLVRAIEYQKKRERWRLADCVVELDEPACLGLFVEIEGPTESSIRAVQEQLGLAALTHINASYVDMADAYCQAYDVFDRRLTMPPIPT